MTATFGLLPVNAGGILIIDCNANNGNKTMAKSKEKKKAKADAQPTQVVAAAPQPPVKPTGIYDYALKTLLRQKSKLEAKQRHLSAFGNLSPATSDQARYDRTQARLHGLNLAIDVLDTNNLPQG